MDTPVPDWGLKLEARAFVMRKVTSGFCRLPGTMRWPCLPRYLDWNRSVGDAILRMIFSYSPVEVPSSASQGVYIHILTSSRDWIMALWTCRTFLINAAVRFPVFFHDDGTLGPSQVECILRAFPGGRVILRSEADRRADKVLSRFSYCRKARRRIPELLKLTDPWMWHDGDAMILDSDLLFFSRVSEILSWINSDRLANRLNRDIENAYCLTKSDVHEHLGIRLIDRLNSGLALCARRSMDYQLVEAVLEFCEINKPTLHVEQTVQAILSSRYGAELLSDKYLIDINPSTGIPDGTVCKHYVGTVRALMAGEGIRTILRENLAKGVSTSA